MADDSTFRFFDAAAKGKERARVALREDGSWFEAASGNYDAGGGLESKLADCARDRSQTRRARGRRAAWCCARRPADRGRGRRASRSLPLGAAGSGVAADDTHVYWTENTDDHGTEQRVLLRVPWTSGERQLTAGMTH
jgi:hypothetical protein